MANLKLISFNCNSFRKHIDIVRKLLNVSDIRCLQETFLNSDDEGYLDKIDKRFNFAFMPCTNDNVLNSGRPKGGLVIFWRTTFDVCVKPVIFHDRFLGVKLIGAEMNYLIINVYMPCINNTSENVVSYRDILANIDNEIDSIYIAWTL